MTGIRWIKEAGDLGGFTGGTITSTAPARVVWHSTESGSSSYATIAKMLAANGNWPNIMYDPWTDRLGQFCALDTSSRALKNGPDNYQTNRTGKQCIQIEVVAHAHDPFTRWWKPGPNYRALMAALRSWGIPETWPAGSPPPSPPGAHASARSRQVWEKHGGHYSHSQIPFQDHTDPGAIDVKRLFAAGHAGAR